MVSPSSLDRLSDLPLPPGSARLAEGSRPGNCASSPEDFCNLACRESAFDCAFCIRSWADFFFVPVCAQAVAVSAIHKIPSPKVAFCIMFCFFLAFFLVDCCQFR